MYILGINGGFRQGYQDVSAVLIKDGYVIAAIEEERLSRIKFSAGRLPFLSIIEVLKIGGISIKDIDHVAFHGSTWGEEFKGKLSSYFFNHFGYCPDIRQYHHHDCHAASAYYASGFQEALIITIDSSGDGVSIQVATGIDGKIDVLNRDERPNSLGIFYSLITQYCGFTKESDEYKLMGLSAYGRSDKMDFSWLLYFKEGKTLLNKDFLINILPGQPSPHKNEMLFNTTFLQKMGATRRIPGTVINKFYKDVAASAQQHFEQIITSIAEYYVEKTGLKKICMAGGRP